MTAPAPVSPEVLLGNLNWRYATKVFDPNARLDAKTVDALIESAVLAPSSFGLQPWKFLLVRDPGVRAKLREVSWGQSQVTDASHLLVFLGMRTMDEAHVDRYVAANAAVTGTPPEKLKAYRDLMVGAVTQGPISTMVPEWTARQTYIALGQVMASAAMLGVDTCPLEGLDPAAYEKILGVDTAKWRVLCALALGHRGEGDRLAKAPKVRFPRADVVTEI